MTFFFNDVPKYFKNNFMNVLFRDAFVDDVYITCFRAMSHVYIGPYNVNFSAKEVGAIAGGKQFIAFF